MTEDHDLTQLELAAALATLALGAAGVIALFLFESLAAGVPLLLATTATGFWLLSRQTHRP